MAKSKTVKTDNKLLAKLLGGTKVEGASVLSESKFFSDVECVRTEIPALNLALSGSLSGGYGANLTVLAGPSRVMKCLGPDTVIEVYVDE